MRRKLSCTMPAVLSIVLALCPTFAQSAAHAVTPAAWTVMVYVDADNDLERAMMKNLEEMSRVGSTEQVNIIALAARSPEGNGKYSNAGVANLPNWTSAKLLRVNTGKLQELADWGAVDMGDSGSLQRFIATVVQSYPAQRYALLLGDHGMAWAGAAVAESMGDGDSLSVDDMAAAFKSSLSAGVRFDLIGFDACVMANLEVARTLAPYARYLVASEEIEPSDGWDYAALLSALAQSPQMDGAQLGHVIVDTYRDFYAKSAHHDRAAKAKALTLSVIDLDRIAEVDKAVKALGADNDALLKRGGHAAWLQLARAHGESEEYGRSAIPVDQPLPGGDVYDLISMGANVKKQSRDPATSAAAEALIAAAGQAVVYNMHGIARPQAHGLSIFYPPTQATLAVRGKTSYKETSFAAGSAWYPYLRDYVDFPASAAERNRPKPAIDPVTATGRMLHPHEKVNVASQVHADDIDEARFVISMMDGNTRVIIGSIPVDLKQDGDLKQEWDGEWFTISDNDNEFIAPITEFEEVGGAGNDDLYWAGVPAKLRLANTQEWLSVTLYFPYTCS